MKRLGLGTNEKGFSIVYFGTFGLVLRADEEPKHEKSTCRVDHSPKHGNGEGTNLGRIGSGHLRIRFRHIGRPS